jgi:hypothetical protein
VPMAALEKDVFPGSNKNAALKDLLRG